MSSADVQRFGRVFSIWVAALMLLNMGIAMTAEYTAVGDLFELVIGTNRVPIVVIIGVVSMLYTAYGGLYVSIITDQWQVRLWSQAIVTMIDNCHTSQDKWNCHRVKGFSEHACLLEDGLHLWTLLQLWQDEAASRDLAVTGAPCVVRKQKGFPFIFLV